MRFTHAGIDRKRLLEYRRRIIHAPRAIPREPELVEDAGVSIIEGNEGLVAFDGAFVAAQRDVHISEGFKGPERAWINVRGAAEITQRGFELVLLQIHRT